MVAVAKSLYACNECGGTSPKWQGRCPHCDAWNTLVESVAALPASASKNRLSANGAVAALHAPERATLSDEAARRAAEADRIDELDRARRRRRAGGVVLSARPGIGKSTLLCRRSTPSRAPCGALVRARSRRAGRARSRRPASAASASRLAEIQLGGSWPRSRREPAVAVVDSIQTLWSDACSATGSVAQVRECAAQMTRFSKASGTTIVLVGPSPGRLARGPRVMEPSSTRCST